MNGNKNPLLISKPEYPLDYEEFTNPPTQEQNVGEELAQVEDLLSSEEASIQEPDSAAALSSQSAPPMDLVGDIHSASPLQEATIQENGSEDSAAAPSSQFDTAFLLLWAAGLASENRLNLD